MKNTVFWDVTLFILVDKKSKEMFNNDKLESCESKRCFFFFYLFSTSFILFASYIALSFLFLSSCRFFFHLLPLILSFSSFYFLTSTSLLLVASLL
jgi:hypothetical protein